MTTYCKQGKKGKKYYVLNALRLTTSVKCIASFLFNFFFFFFFQALLVSSNCNNRKIEKIILINQSYAGQSVCFSSIDWFLSLFLSVFLNYHYYYHINICAKQNLTVKNHLYHERFMLSVLITSLEINKQKLKENRVS